MDSDTSGNTYQYPLSYSHHQPGGNNYYATSSSYFDQPRNDVPTSYTHHNAQAQRTQQPQQPQHHTQSQSQQPQHQQQMRLSLDLQGEQRDQEYLEQLFREQRQRHEQTQYQQTRTQPAPVQAQPSQPQQTSQPVAQGQYQQQSQYPQYQRSQYQQKQYSQSQASQYQPGGGQKHHRQSQKDIPQPSAQGTAVSQSHPRHLHNPLATTAAATSSSQANNAALERQNAGDALAALANSQYHSADTQKWGAVRSGPSTSSTSTGSASQQHWSGQREGTSRSQIDNSYDTIQSTPTTSSYSETPTPTTTTTTGFVVTQTGEQATEYPRVQADYSSATDNTNSRYATNSTPLTHTSQVFQPVGGNRGHTYPTQSSVSKRQKLVSPTYSKEQPSSASSAWEQQQQKPASKSASRVAYQAATTTPGTSSPHVPVPQTLSDRAYQTTATTTREHEYTYQAATAAPQSHKPAVSTPYQHKKTSSTSSASGTKNASKGSNVPQSRSTAASASKIQNYPGPVTNYAATTAAKQTYPSSTFHDTSSLTASSLQQVHQQEPPVSGSHVQPEVSGGQNNNSNNNSYFTYSQSNDNAQQSYGANHMSSNNWQERSTEDTGPEVAQIRETPMDVVHRNQSEVTPKATKKRAPSKPRAKAGAKPRAPKVPKAQQASAVIPEVSQTQTLQDQGGAAAYTQPTYQHEDAQGYSVNQQHGLPVTESQHYTNTQTQAQPTQHPLAATSTGSSDIQQSLVPPKKAPKPRKPRAKSTKKQTAQPQAGTPVHDQVQHEPAGAPPHTAQSYTPQQYQHASIPSAQHQHGPTQHQEKRHDSQRQTQQATATTAQVSHRYHQPEQSTAADTQRPSNPPVQRFARQQPEVTSNESARTNASVSNLISPGQQQAPSTANEPSRIDPKSQELSKMEQDMREMVEKMREYQSRNPAVFQAMWDHVKKTDQGNRSQRSPSMVAAKPHERMHSPRTQPSVIAATDSARPPSQAPQPALPPVRSTSQVPKAGFTQGPPPSPLVTEHTPHLPQIQAQAASAPRLENVSASEQSPWPPTQRNAICESIISFLSSTSGGPKPVPRDMVDRLLERPIMPSFSEFCVTFESYGYQFNRKALAEELLKAFPETPEDGVQGVNANPSASATQRPTSNAAPSSLPPTTSYATRPAGGSKDDAIVLNDDIRTRPPPSARGSTPFTVQDMAKAAHSSKAEKTLHGAPDGSQAVAPSSFQHLGQNQAHFMEVPRNPTPQLIRSLKVVQYDGAKSPVQLENFEPNRSYITPSLIYNSIPPLSSTLSRSLSRQSPVPSKESEPNVSKTPSAKGQLSAVESSVPMMGQGAAQGQPGLTPGKPASAVSQGAVAVPLGPSNDSISADKRHTLDDNAVGTRVQSPEPIMVDEQAEPPRPETPKSLIVKLKVASKGGKTLLQVLKFKNDYEMQMAAAKRNAMSNGKAAPALLDGKGNPQNTTGPSTLNASKVGSMLPETQVLRTQTSEDGDTFMADAATAPIIVKPKVPSHSLPVVPSFNKKQARKTNRYDPANIANAVLVATGRHPVEKPLNSVFLPWLDANPPLANYHSDLGQIPWDTYDPAPAFSGENIDGDDPMDVDDSIGDGSISGIPGFSARGGTTRRRGRRPKLDPTGSPHVAPSTPEPSLTPGRGKRGRKRGVRVVNGKVVVTPHGTADAVGDGDTPEQTSRSGPTPTRGSRGRGRGRSGRGAGGLQSSRPSNAGVQGSPLDISFRKRRFSSGSSDTPGSGSRLRRIRTPMQSYECKWEKCGAELHNYDTLKQHVIRRHKNITTRGKFPCHWKGCHKSGDDLIARRDFENGLLWDAHMLGDHLEAIRSMLGNGPEGGIDTTPRSHSYGMDESMRRISVDFEGRQVTPIASPAPRGYQFTPPPGFRPNEEFHAAHADEGDTQSETGDMLETLLLVGAGVAYSNAQPEFFEGGLANDTRRLLRRDEDAELASFGKPFSSLVRKLANNRDGDMHIKREV